MTSYQVEREEYRQTLQKLVNLEEEFGLQERPDGRVRIRPGTEAIGRPVGAELPIYKGKLPTNETGMAKIHFNLSSLIPGFKSRRR